MRESRRILTGETGRDRDLVFVAICTGQVVANLPPIFELVEPDRDGVIWVSSPEADRGGWLAASRRAVGYRHPGLPQDEVRTDATYVADWTPEAIAAFREVVGPRLPVLVANGGTKLMAESVRHILSAGQDGPMPIVYGEIEPRLVLLPQGIAGPVFRRAYSRERAIGLAEMLLAAGHEPRPDPARSRCLWPRPRVEAEPEPDGQDAARTIAQHREAWNAAQALRISTGEPPLHADLTSEERARLNRSLGLHGRNTHVRVDPENAYNAARRLALDAAAARARAGAGAGPEPAEAGGIGERFNAAVGARLVRFLGLEGNADIAANLGEAWAFLPVADPATGQVRAEFDVLLVFVNGAAVHLECKTWLRRDGDAALVQKDLTARVLTLQRATSRIARLVICLPCYTAAAGEDWFIALERAARDRLAGFETIRFTLPGQPGSFAAPDDGRTVPVPAFETALRRLLERYA